MSVLVVPLDVSQVGDQERKQQKVKIAVKAGDKITAQVVDVAGGKAEVKLDVDAKQPLTVAIGPDNVSDEDIFNFQTLTANVSPNQWSGKNTLKLSNFIVSPAWWLTWLRWCRTFVIQGRVVCADGSPVPGAEVRAFDVDFFWWWSSVSPVGPVAITDASGHFAMKFRWCCGWWPWWWWKLRNWALEPLLVEKIQPILKLNPALKFGEPGPVPWFDAAALNPQPLPPRFPGLATGPVETFPIPRRIEPGSIPTLRDRLVTLLPRVPELERLRIWPWFPWTPWLDCSPDLIFRVTQDCGGGLTKVIVNENIFQTRWDVPTNLNVVLVANKEACCIKPPPKDPPGDCALISAVCSVPVDQIGGNAGVPMPVGYGAPPIGYASPGTSDRPFSEGISLSGQFGSGAQADFYEIEFRRHSGGPWAPVPVGCLSGFSRQVFDGTLPFGSQWSWPGFPVMTFGPRQVYESRQHYENTHPPNNWGSPFGRSWTQNRDLLASIQTQNFFADDAYDFQLIGYTALASGDPDFTTRKVIPGCGGPGNNLVVVRTDNRVAFPPPPGTVHVNTTEPDCGITAVRFGGVVVAPCGNQKLDPNAPFQIDFFATDSDPIGHLERYDLVLKWGLGNQRDLLSLGGTLTADFGANPGPTYASIPAASRPAWKGGNMHLTFNHGGDVFKETCCYLIELTVRKRNIVGCGNNLAYYNEMHYSFTVIV
jgi:hypothetical protein